MLKDITLVIFSPLVHEVIGTKGRGTVRVIIGYFNTKEDIDKLVYALNNL